jgi:gamma-glutamyltranspeptidase/glutathione hydrolase
MRRRRFSLVVVFALVFSFALAPRARAAAPAPAVGMHGMVVAAERNAAEAGRSMLAAGGNAIDAAVATAFALGVTEPYHSGLGGGGFLLIRLADGRVIALDARETAPAAATRDMFVRAGVAADASKEGPLAVATPGLVAGLAQALAVYGTKPLAEVMAPAIRLAANGFPISLRHARTIEAWKGMGLATRFPETARIQLPPAGTPIAPGWKLVQPELAASLRAISREGPDVFYRGRIAQAIAAEMQRRGGLVTADDLAHYATKLREPLLGTYRGYEVVSFPPPSSGGVALIEMLNVLEGFPLATLGAGSSASIHRIAESMKLAFADRASYLGDPDFVKVPTDALVAKEYAAKLRARIDPPRLARAPWTWGRDEVAIKVTAPGLGDVPLPQGGTTHFSVTDAAGNAVAITQTVNLLFGSGITVADTGIVLNDEMDDFSVAPNQPNAFGLVDVHGTNAVGPGRRPLSSMTPVIVLENGKVRIVAGSPGGPRIITTVLLALVNMIDFGLDPSEAIAQPRFHHQWIPDELSVEAGIPADVQDALRRRGHVVKVAERNWSSAQVIEIDPKTGWQLGASDPRTDGAALGY